MRSSVLVGVDAAYDTEHALVAAAAVVWDANQGAVVEEHVALAAKPAPYVPGRFAEREVDVTVAALAALRCRPAAVLCDAHGRAHPAQWGMACEIARATRVPTIGCAKSLLCGVHAPVDAERGSWANIVFQGEIVGRVLRTQTGVRPVFVSVGGLIDIGQAVDIVLLASQRFRLPEPLRSAHQRAQGELSKVLATARTHA